MKKAFSIILIFTICCFLVWFFFFKEKKDKRITLYGNIEIRQTDLSFRVSGRLNKLFKEEGDYVKEGELLAEIEDDIYKAALNKAKGNVKEKRAQKIKNEAIFNYNHPLCHDFTISKEECSNITQNVEIAKGEYKVSVSELEKAIIDLDDTKMYAPYDGVILSRVREKGTILSSGETVYSISMLQPVWVRAFIEEPMLGKIKLGQKALIYTDSRPKKPYLAHIGFISPVAEFTPKTVETTSLRADLVYRVRIIVDNVDPYLRQGMPVTVKILEDEI